MNTTYFVTDDFANAVRKIKNPWFIVSGGSVVGVYEGRAAACAAKSAGAVGSIVSSKEIEIAASGKEIAAEKITSKDFNPVGYEEHGLTHCPACGIHLSNGVGVHNQEVNGEYAKNTKFEYCCLGCDAEFGPAIKTTPESKVKGEGKAIKNRSAVEKPCRLVWDLADSMPGARRKDVIAAAEAKGVAFYTARTQYQLWAQVQKEMAEREAAVKK